MQNLFDSKEARVEVFGVEDTIHNHLANSRCQIKNTETNNFSFFKIGTKLFPKEYYVSFKKMLWCKYLKGHPEIDTDCIPKPFRECLKFNKTEEGKEFATLLKSQGLMVIQKDIFQSPQDIICHQVNCQGVMGSGIAKEIRERFPKAYENYKKACDKIENKKDLLGKAQLINCGEHYIANIFGQETYGRTGCYTDYNAFAQSLMRIKERAKEMGLSVCIPYGIGCSLAGGDWNTISNIIANTFNDYPVIIYQKI